MKIYKYMFILLALSGSIFVNAAPSSVIINTQAPSQVDPEIAQFVDQFVKKWNRHDPKELVELWAENGDLINPSGEWEKGKVNVIKILSREHQGILSESKMTQEVTNVIRLSPTLAWVDAKVTLDVPGVPEGLDHHIVYLLQKQNDQWRILAIRPYQFLELHLGLIESPHASRINK